MKVKEAIETLQGFDSELEVFVFTDGGYESIKTIEGYQGLPEPVVDVGPSESADAFDQRQYEAYIKSNEFYEHQNKIIEREIAEAKETLKRYGVTSVD